MNARLLLLPLALVALACQRPAVKGENAAPQPYKFPHGTHVEAGLAWLEKYAGEIRWDPTRPDGQPRRALDTSRAKERFGFEAGTDFEEGLRRTIAWYKTSRK